MPSQISITVDASSTSTYELAEHYQCRVTWTESGALQYVHTIYFDCVLQTYQPDAGVTDLVAEEIDIEERLTRHAAASDSANVRVEPLGRQEVRRGYASNLLYFYPRTTLAGWVTASACTFTLHKPDGTEITSGSGTITAISGTATRTVTTMAAQYVQRGWLTAEDQIRNIMQTKAWVRPRLIVDLDRMRSTIAAFAMHHVYSAEGGGSDSPEAEKADRYFTEGVRRLTTQGTLRYDDNEDRTPDTDLTGWATVSTRRAW